MFVCKSITISFFRVTQFRAIFLEAVCKKSRSEAYDDELIMDNSRNINIDELVDSCIIHHHRSTNLSNFFNWDARCFDFIDNKDKDINIKIIESILDTNNQENLKWAERIRHRGRSFFMIIQTWVRFVKRVVN